MSDSDTSNQERSTVPIKVVPLVPSKCQHARRALKNISAFYANADAQTVEAAHWEEFLKDFDAFLVNIQKELKVLSTMFNDFTDNYIVYLRNGDAHLVNKKKELDKLVSNVEEQRHNMKNKNQKASCGKLLEYVNALKELTRQRKSEQVGAVAGTVLVLFYKILHVFVGPFVSVGFPFYDLLRWLRHEQCSLLQQMTDRDNLGTQERNLELVEQLLFVLQDCEPRRFHTEFSESVKHLDAVAARALEVQDANILYKELDTTEKEVKKLSYLVGSLQQAILNEL